jgi:hypothetical protein
MKRLFSLLIAFVGFTTVGFSQAEYVSTGSGNAYSLVYPANITAVTPGLSFTFKANHANTGASTLTVNGFLYTIKKGVTADLEGGDILANQVVTVVFDGTNFQMTTLPGSPGGGGGDFMSDGTIQMTGQFVGANGTAAAPGISFTGGLSNGMYRPATNAIGLVSNATERIRIAPNGNIGIGNTGPGSKLDLSGDMNFNGMTVAPGLAPTNAGRIYFDFGSQKFKVSENGGAWVDLVRSGTTVHDADGDTYIELEAVADEDVIHFGMGDNLGYPAGEYFTMTGPLLEVFGSGESVFIGEEAGLNDDLTSNYNVAIGRSALNTNASGASNVGIGYAALSSATTSNNTGIGFFAGVNSSTGVSNTFIGYRAGVGNTTGGYNTVIGSTAGDDNITGSNLVLLGFNAEPSTDGLSNAIAIGSNAIIAQSNAMALGGTGANAVDVGIGTETPESVLHIEDANTNANESQLTIKADNSFGATSYAAVEFQSNFSGASVGPSGRIISEYTSPSFTSARMTFQTIAGGPSFVNTMTLTDGKVGIRTTTPSAELDVNGDLGLANDANRLERGGSGGDMIPVAYGVINDGALQVNASEGDITVAKVALGHYRVTYNGARTFTGHGEFAMSLTTVDQSGGGNPIIATYAYSSLKTVDVYLYDIVGNSPVDGIVTFELRVK